MAKPNIARKLVAVPSPGSTEPPHVTHPIDEASVNIDYALTITDVLETFEDHDLATEVHKDTIANLLSLQRRMLQEASYLLGSAPRS
jgi:hypothetical protein